jgi:6-phosphogluconolactonase
LKINCLSVLALALIALSGSLKAESEFVYVAASGGLWSFAIDHHTGSLTSLGAPAAPGNFESLVIDRSGRFLYAETSRFVAAENIEQFNIAAYRIRENGELTPLPGSPFNVAGGTLALDPLGRFLFAAAHDEAGSLSTYRICADGALSPVRGSAVSGGSFPVAVTVDPFGRFVYVANFISADLSAYRVLEDGALVPLPGSPFSLNHANPMALVIERFGRFLYAGNFAIPSISSFRIEPNGALAALAGSPLVLPGNFVEDMALDPLRGFIYLSEGSGEGRNIFAYRMNNSTGALEQVPGEPFEGGIESFGVAVDPLRKFVYVTNANDLPIGPGPGSISGYRIGPNGALTQVSGSPFSTPNGLGVPTSIAISPPKFWGERLLP